MNVSKLSLVLLVIGSNLPILGGCCGNKNNGKNKESKSTPGGGSKPKPNPNPKPNPKPNLKPNYGPIGFGPSSFTPHGPSFSATPGPGFDPSFLHHGPSFSATTPVDYNSKTLDDIKLPSDYEQDQIGNYEYNILANCYGIPREEAEKKVKEGKIKYYKTKDSYNYNAYILFYDIFNDDDSTDTFKLTSHIHYINYNVDEHGPRTLVTWESRPEFFFGNN